MDEDTRGDCLFCELNKYLALQTLASVLTGLNCLSRAY